MKYAQMVCSISQNIGDDVQSIAAAAQLPRVDLYVDRERLDAVEGPDPVGTIMNAWFLEGDRWPPSRALSPIFVGFHVAPKSRDLVAKHAPYLKSFEPIGTRDKGTAEFLASLGIAAEVTYCMTLTFPTRTMAPAHGRVVIVDAAGVQVPRTLRRHAVRLSHVVPLMRDATKLQYARELIEYYRDNARLIITTRLHCALPCIAMGIPVVFFGNPKDYRTSIVRDIGGIIYDGEMHRKELTPRSLVGRALGRVDWSPKPLDVSAVKTRLLEAVSARMEPMARAE